MGRKNKHIINWNIITLITTTSVIIISIFLNYNQREINILQSELNISEKRINELESELDPSWHRKFNNQKEYYENKILQKEFAINEKSILLNELQTNNGLLLSKEQKVEIVKTLMAYPLVLKEINLLKEINNSNERIIEIQKEMLSINNTISEAENSKSPKSNRILYLGLIIFSIISLISAYIVYKRK